MPSISRSPTEDQLLLLLLLPTAFAGAWRHRLQLCGLPGHRLLGDVNPGGPGWADGGAGAGRFRAALYAGR